MGQYLEFSVTYYMVAQKWELRSHIQRCPHRKRLNFSSRPKKEREKNRFYQGAIFPNKATKKGEWKGEKKIPVLSGGYCCKHRNKEGEFVFLNSTNRYKVVTLVL